MRYLLYIAIAVAALGCTFSESSDFANIDPKGWAYGDTLSLTAQSAGWDQTLSDTTLIRHGDLSIVVRHTNSYPYSNIWLQVDYTGTDSILTDTVNLQLADEFGNWLGSGVGMDFQRQAQVLTGIDIDVSRPVRVSHIMRVDTLPDIEQIGIVFDINR